MPHPRCPKCRGRLFLDDDRRGSERTQPELACLACGWRETITVAQLVGELGIREPTAGTAGHRGPRVRTRA